MQSTLYTIVFGLYIIGMLAVGYYSSRKVKSFEDYMVAGRRLSVPLLTTTLLATFIGGGTLLGIMGHIASFGISDIWIFVAAGIGFILMGVLGKKLRGQKKYTMPELVGARYGGKTKVLLGLMILVAVIGFIGVQLKASGTILGTMLGISYTNSILLASVFVIVYTMLGGLWADTLTDMIQVVIIFIGLVLAVPFALHSAGGWTQVVEKLSVSKPDVYFNPMGQGIVFTVGAIFVISLTIITNPNYHQRIYGARDERTARTAAVSAGVIYFILGFIFVAVAIIGASLYPELDNMETLFPHMALDLFPPILGVIVLSALMAAVMSTVDSHLLTISSVLARDFYQGFLNPDATDKTLLRLSRIFVLAIGIIGIIFAIYFRTILDLLVFTWGLIISAAAVPILFAFLWKRANNIGGFASVLLGGGSNLLFAILGVKHEIAILPSIFISLIAMIVFSLLTAKPSEKQVEQFFPKPEGE